VLNTRAESLLRPWVLLIPQGAPSPEDADKTGPRAALPSRAQTPVFQLGANELRQLRDIPGVTRVLFQQRRLALVRVERARGDTAVFMHVVSVDTDWLTVTGRVLLDGRLWNPAEQRANQSVALWEGRAAEGATGWLSLDGRRSRVLGHLGLGAQLDALSAIPTLYVPASLTPTPDAIGLALLLIDTTQATPSKVAAQSRKLLRSLWALSPLEPDPVRIDTPDAAREALRKVARLLWGTLAAGMLLPAALAGLALAGLLRLSTARRLPELGLRRSVGATRQQILSLVLGDAVRLGLEGSGLGALIALGGLLGVWAAGLPVSCPWPIIVVALLLPPTTAVAFALGPAAWAAHVSPWRASQGW